MELRGKQNVPQTQATDTKQESTGANQSNEDSAPESSAQTSKAANAETDTSATNAGKESDIEAQLASLEKTVREKTGKIEKSIAEVNNVLGPAEPVLETKPRPGLPSSCQTLRIISRRASTLLCFPYQVRFTRNRNLPMAQTATVVPVPDFLTQESDADLRNITMTAMQAEREAAISLQQEISQRAALSAFGAAGVLNDEASGFAELARAHTPSESAINRGAAPSHCGRRCRS